ncbi:DUF1223 domain-containing protein [Phenylobacterium kunshanense]|uniref:DUF1223 domain-containing protein n=1 Tax=Phenylobacterium kunshanense TaxID=1445034 RepID=A0A328BK22_9CAUL|nr:DUF1223 domain-containing protein [Phenylobacterium kunshanense]RAK67670.1 DUF1223 domain-containing protein [Phenylobacterium kunshanense]
MRKAALISLILLAWPAGAAAARPPVLVELFTAQGCGACAEANAYVAKLAERPGVVALTFSVDYWDYLGWTDTFASPGFAKRQQAYVARLKLREPYTPQVVVDGHEQAQGQKAAEVDRLIRAAVAAPRNPPDMRFIGSRRADVGSGRAPRGGAEVWMIRYDPRTQEVTPKAGENRGEAVTHRNVVRQIERLGTWRGRPQAYRLPAMSEEGLKTLVVVQAPRGGRVLGLLQQP